MHSLPGHSRKAICTAEEQTGAGYTEEDTVGTGRESNEGSTGTEALIEMWTIQKRPRDMSCVEEDLELG